MLVLDYHRSGHHLCLTGITFSTRTHSIGVQESYAEEPRQKQGGGEAAPRQEKASGHGCLWERQWLA